LGASGQGTAGPGVLAAAGRPGRPIPAVAYGKELIFIQKKANFLVFMQKIPLNIIRKVYYCIMTLGITPCIECGFSQKFSFGEKLKLSHIIKGDIT
jgi:hypothetical protein